MEDYTKSQCREDVLALALDLIKTVERAGLHPVTAQLAVDVFRSLLPISLSDSFATPPDARGSESSELSPVA